MTGYLIRHTYPGTINGREVGDVYVTGPHFVEHNPDRSIWSHTYNPAEAAVFATVDEAERELARRSWRRNVRIVPRDGAPTLEVK
jgi:hypothetical protein